MIIDAHSHIAYETDRYVVGANYMWPIVPQLFDYDKFAKDNNISTVLFSPCTSPIIYDKENNIKYYNLLWDYVDGKFVYYSMIDNDGIKEKFNLKSNPYKQINELMYNYLSNTNSFCKKYYLPAINLMLDTVDYLDDLYWLGSIAFKVHGISSGLDDLKKINPSLLKYISEKKIPIQIHTDYTCKVNTPIDKLYSANNPLSWIELLNYYDVKGFFAHGCRLSIEAANRIKGNKNFLTGISPDLLLQHESERLMTKTDNFLKDMLDIFDENSIAFDIDYGWNIKNRVKYEMDYNQLDRLMPLFKNEVQKKKILVNNSKEFFRIG